MMLSLTRNHAKILYSELLSAKQFVFITDWNTWPDKIWFKDKTCMKSSDNNFCYLLDTYLFIKKDFAISLPLSLNTEFPNTFHIFLFLPPGRLTRTYKSQHQNLPVRKKYKIKTKTATKETFIGNMAKYLINVELQEHLPYINSRC